jgi:hypothetical protein
MKKINLTILTIILLFSKQAQCQNNGAATAVAALAGVATIGAIVATIEEMEERAELKATQWLLDNHPEFSTFNLYTFDFNGKKARDLSSTTVISFKVQEFTPKAKPELDGKKYVLFCFTSYGWITEQGIDFNKVSWYLIDNEEWMKMMIAYTKMASEEKNEDTLREALMNGVIDNKGIKVKGKLSIPFYKLDGDSYLVTDYSPTMKFIYNEKSLCIFLKNTRDLVQMKRQTIIDTHLFFYP